MMDSFKSYKTQREFAQTCYDILEKDDSNLRGFAVTIGHWETDPQTLAKRMIVDTMVEFKPGSLRRNVKGKPFLSRFVFDFIGHYFGTFYKFEIQPLLYMESHWSASPSDCTCRACCGDA